MINLYITSSTLWLISFTITILTDLLLRKYLSQNALAIYIKLINSNYLTIYIVLFIIIYTILSLLSICEILSINIITEFNSSVGDISILCVDNPDPNGSTINNSGVVGAATSNLNVGQGGTINVNSPKGNFSISTDGLYNFASALGSTGGAAIGFKMAQHLGGTPLTKLGVTAAVMAAVQTATVLGAKHMNPNNQGSSGFKHNFISNTNSGSLDLSQFPLNLLPDLDVLSSCCLVFIFFLLNIYIVRIIISVDFNKYLPNNLLGRLLLKLINRYITIWSKMSNFFLIIGWVSLLCSTLLIKWNLHFIVTY